MADNASAQNWLSTAGTWSVGIGFFMMILETITTGESVIGSSCCCFGVFGLIAGGIVSSSGAAVSSDGSMVLKQDKTGQWNWVSSSANQTSSGDMASQYNNQDTQIMSRVISELRSGKTLQDLETNELDIVASAYGVDSGSREQKIEALHNSSLAKSALKLGALGVAGGAGAIGTAHIIKSGRERAIQRAEELKQQGREKLQENIDAGLYSINSKLPVSESGEEATDVAGNIVMDQLRKQIEERNLTPQMLLEIGDVDGDGRLNPTEIAGALTAATGFTVPVFIVNDAIKDFDLNKDGTLDLHEMNTLWTKLGFEVNQEGEFSDDEIDEVLDEVENPQDIVEESDGHSIDNVVEESIGQTEDQQAFEDHQTHLPEETITQEETKELSIPEDTELTEEIDTEFERLVLEMEGARFSSERRTLMEKQTSEFLVTLKIDRMERTLIGDPIYRSGQSVHALIDGGPYTGLVKIPVSFDEKILQYKQGDEIQVWASLVDFSPSLKRPVLEASEIV